MNKLCEARMCIDSPLARYPVARPETTEDILRRCLTLCPELAPPDVRAQRAGTVDDLRPFIVEVGCGLRPAREGGLRLQHEWVDAGKGGKIPLIHNYGCVTLESWT